MSILVGTAGWTDKSLIDSGLFYPAEVKTAEQRLRYYAERYPLVEIDSSYYGMPSEQNAHLWAERTPEHFLFNVKAFRLFTGHQTPPKALPKDIREALQAEKNVYYKDVPEELRDELWKRFAQALEPLRLAGKLGALHFQFPPWMAFHRESFAHLEDVRARLPEHQLAVEFRNRTWFAENRRERTLRFQRDNRLANVVVDEPQGFASSIPTLWEVTSPELAVVRLHGRNAETWEKKGLKASSERFNYDYSEAELSEMVKPIEGLAQQAKEVHVIFNNNYQDQGQRNAKTMMGLLDRAG